MEFSLDFNEVLKLYPLIKAFVIEYQKDILYPSIILLLFSILLLVFINPDKIDAWKANFIHPFFRYFGLCANQYIAARIGSSVSKFINENYAKFLSSAHKIRLRIKWVTSESDPIFKKNGTIILHLQETKDQDLNTLIATKAALPGIICPSLRFNISPDHLKSIDLTFLKKVVTKLGKHAPPFFRNIFWKLKLIQITGFKNSMKN